MTKNKTPLFKQKQILKNILCLCLALNLFACAQVPKHNNPPVASHQTTYSHGTASQINRHKISPRYICKSPHSYVNQVIGNGECVSLIRQCSTAPHTTQWNAGEYVLSQKPGSIAEGSIIATFKNGVYPSRTGYHAAIYISHNPDGIWVWDQWVGKAVHKRFIRTRFDKASASNTAQAYRLVK